MTSNERRAEIQERLNEIFCDVFDDDDIEIFDDMTAADIAAVRRSWQNPVVWHCTRARSRASER